MYYIILYKGPAARTATVPLGAGTAGHSPFVFCKRPVSCGIPAGIPAGTSAQQSEAGVLDCRSRTFFSVLCLISYTPKGIKYWAEGSPFFVFILEPVFFVCTLPEFLCPQIIKLQGGMLAFFFAFWSRAFCLSVLWLISYTPKYRKFREECEPFFPVLGRIFVVFFMI